MVIRKKFDSLQEAQEAADMQDNLPAIILELTNRIALCERVFSKILQLDMRIDTLEFNSGLPVKPAIGEKLMDIDGRLLNLELLLLKKERENER